MKLKRRERIKDIDYNLFSSLSIALETPEFEVTLWPVRRKWNWHVCRSGSLTQYPFRRGGPHESSGSTKTKKEANAKIDAVIDDYMRRWEEEDKAAKAVEHRRVIGLYNEIP